MEIVFELRRYYVNVHEKVIKAWLHIKFLFINFTFKNSAILKSFQNTKLLLYGESGSYSSSKFLKTLETSILFR